MSETRPTEVGKLKKGSYIVIESEPYRVVSVEKSKPGKHGAAKARITAIGVFTNKRKSIVSPVDAIVDTPIIKKRTCQVIAIPGEFVQVMDLETYEVFEVPFPDNEELKSQVEIGKEVTVWSSLGYQKIMQVK